MTAFRIHPFLSRREFLRRSGMGMGALGLGECLGSQNLWTSTAAGAESDQSARAPRAAFRAESEAGHPLLPQRRPSHVDTFDPKPSLAKYAGQPLPGEYLRTERKTGAAFPSPFKFQRYGQSGLEISELFAKTAAHADDIAVVRSMYAQVPNHEPCLMLMNCGDSVQARPSVGVVGALWPGHGESEPARIRRDVPRRLSDQGLGELAVRLSARSLSRHLHRLRSTRSWRS